MIRPVASGEIGRKLMFPLGPAGSKVAAR